MRLVLAGGRTDGVVERLIPSIRTHANVRIICMSDTLSKQIPTSHEANAFNFLTLDLLHYSLLQACTFWDPVDLDSYSIPTISALADNKDVEQMVLDKRFSEYYLYDKQIAKQSARRSVRKLRLAIFQAHRLENSDLLLRARNVRDKIAHQLLHTRRDREAMVAPSKSGEITSLLKRTVALCDLFHSSLNGTSFDWQSTCEMSQRDANDLWSKTTIRI